LKDQEDGTALRWAVRESTSGMIVGSTGFHDIVRKIDRVEVGYTFYARRWQGTHINTACKLLLLGHAFDTLGCKVVGLRVDNLNERSQKAVEAIGAKKDGVIRHFQARLDGSARDTHMYSIIAAEWPDVKHRLEARLQRLRG
jgi:RimJ/RimL family protein N-acetyltransferase